MFVAQINGKRVICRCQYKKKILNILYIYSAEMYKNIYKLRPSFPTNDDFCRGNMMDAISVNRSV